MWKEVFDVLNTPIGAVMFAVFLTWVGSMFYLFFRVKRLEEWRFSHDGDSGSLRNEMHAMRVEQAERFGRLEGYLRGAGVIKGDER